MTAEYVVRLHDGEWRCPLYGLCGFGSQRPDPVTFSRHFRLEHRTRLPLTLRFALAWFAGPSVRPTPQGAIP